MNEFAHFLTGYLFGRLLKDPKTGKRYEYYRFECFIVAFAAFSPDLDFLIDEFVPMEHGVYSHTILGALSFAAVISLLLVLFSSKNKESHKISPPRLFFLTSVGVLSHLLLDIVPYLPDDPMARAAELDHHMYFWPLSDFPVHLNTIFSAYSYTIRVWVEVLFTIVIGLILVYFWLFKDELFAKSFFPWFWYPNESKPLSQIREDRIQKITHEIFPINHNLQRGDYINFIFLYLLLSVGMGISYGLILILLVGLTPLIFLILDHYIAQVSFIKKLRGRRMQK